MVVITGIKNGLGVKIRKALVASSAYGVRGYGAFYYGAGAEIHGIYRVGTRWNRTEQHKLSFYWTGNRKTEDQLAQQQKFADMVAGWQDLTDEQKKYYDKLKEPKGMSGYNRYIRFCMLDPSGPDCPMPIGGKYCINVETLTGDKTLTPDTDCIYQYFDEGGDDRIITLDTASASAGDRFVIRHNGAYNDTHKLEVKQGVTTLDYIWAGAIKKFVFDGTNWIAASTGTGEVDTKKYNITIGYKANASKYGVSVGTVAVSSNYAVAIGYNSNAYNYGAAVGLSTSAYNYGVAIGYNASGQSYGVAIGIYAHTSAKYYTVALGYHSRDIRTSEISHNIDGNSAQKNNIVIGGWSKITTDNVETEIFCGDKTNERFTIRPSSVLAFKILITARDNVSGDCAAYEVKGLIKRDAADNTVMSNVTVAVIHEDDAAWDVAVDADDVNEALRIKVTGDADNPVQWAARLDGVETHF